MTDMTRNFTRYLARAAVQRQIAETKNAGARYDHIYLHTWLIVATFCAFATWVAYDNNIFHIMIDTDKSYLSLLTILIFIIASAHAAWHVTTTCGRIKAAGRMLDDDIDEKFHPTPLPASARATVRLSDTPEKFIGNYVRDVKESNKLRGGKRSEDTTSQIMEIYADQLRSPVEIGWFIVDMLVRLGLIGTIIGFILILRSLVSGPLPNADEIQTLLVSMSGGMGTALFTTLAGLSTATLLGLQYMVLGRAVESLIASLIRIEEQTKA